MTKKIILVGCGNVGSRHLQALAKLPYNITVDIVEPNQNAQELAKSRLSEIPYDKTNHIFLWHKSIKELKNKSNLVIVATHSAGRVDLISELLFQGQTRFLVEKFVCQSVDEYKILLEKMKEYNGKGWVNTNRRCFKTYRKVKEFLQGQKTIHLSVLTNSNNGLGTNSIHYLDLFSWLVENNKVKLSGEFLLDELLPNKRGQNYKEFSGTLVGATTNGSFLSMIFLPTSDASVIVNISGENIHFMIDETKEKIFVYGNIDKDYDLEYKFEHVSSLTTKIVDDILKQDDCLLPTLSESFNAHSELFRIFNAHINKLTDENVKLCLIT